MGAAGWYFGGLTQRYWNAFPELLRNDHLPREFPRQQQKRAGPPWGRTGKARHLQPQTRRSVLGSSTGGLAVPLPGRSPQARPHAAYGVQRRQSQLHCMHGMHENCQACQARRTKLAMHAHCAGRLRCNLTAARSPPRPQADHSVPAAAGKHSVTLKKAGHRQLQGAGP